MIALAHVKQFVPWWARIGAKVVLSRLPLGYGFWRQIGLFKLGQMHQAEYALGVFEGHLRRAGYTPRSSCPSVIVEIGPGDSLFTAVIARSFGARRVHLIDAGAFASVDLEAYRALETTLIDLGLSPPSLKRAATVEEVLVRCDGHYGAQGLRSLAAIPSSSVDFIFSHTVLECIRLRDFEPMMYEQHRILRPGGVCSHRVDLKDFLGGALNNLRFSEKVWESNFIAKSGFYTNRLRLPDMLPIFQRAGFDYEILNVKRWEGLPTPRALLAEPFRSMDKESLDVSGFDILLKPRRTMAA